MEEAIQIVTDADGNETGVLLPPMTEADEARSELQAALESLVEAMHYAGAPASAYRGGTAAAHESIKYWNDVERQRRETEDAE